MVGKGFRKYGAHVLGLIAVLALALLISIPAAHAADSLTHTFSTPRFTLHIGPQPSGRGRSISPKSLADQALNVLDNTHSELKRIFSSTPDSVVVLRFLSQSDFQQQTGAPAWTSAMFFRDEISVPLPSSGRIDRKELSRALRHEYVHAFIADLSKHRCPAWLDEGVAQLIEGPPNPLLGPSLRKWIAQNPAMPLDWLHNGFTTLDSEIVPAAYGQSLFATRSLVNTLGFKAVKDYLRYLRSGMSENRAFFQAFGQTKRSFERQLTLQMRRWAHSGRKDP